GRSSASPGVRYPSRGRSPLPPVHSLRSLTAAHSFRGTFANRCGSGYPSRGRSPLPPVHSLRSLTAARSFSREPRPMPNLLAQVYSAAMTLSTMQDFPLSISAILRHGARVYPESECVTWTDAGPRRASFAEVGANAARLANALARLGVG